MSDSVLNINSLIKMANQIGDFFEPYPEIRRTEGIRNHLRTYWDPRMREALLAYIANNGEGIHDHVLAGAKALITADIEKKGYYGPPKA